MVFWPEGQRSVKLRISSRTIRTIEKKGLTVIANTAGLNLWKLAFRDFRQQRLEYRIKNAGNVPIARKTNGIMKNLGSMARSRKEGTSPTYIGGRIFYVKDDEKESIIQLIRGQKEGKSYVKTELNSNETV
jgi:hypothetical protein